MRSEQVSGVQGANFDSLESLKRSRSLAKSGLGPEAGHSALAKTSSVARRHASSLSAHISCLAFGITTCLLFGNNRCNSLSINLKIGSVFSPVKRNTGFPLLGASFCARGGK